MPDGKKPVFIPWQRGVLRSSASSSFGLGRLPCRAGGSDSTSFVIVPQSAGQIRTLYNLGCVGNLPDGELLERFHTHRAEADLAVAAVMARHRRIDLMSDPFAR